MNPPRRRPVLFVDRDGTLIEEPPDEQVDSLDKVRLLPGRSCRRCMELRRAGYRLVMVTNQDGLGSARYPRERFERYSISAASVGLAGHRVRPVFICPHCDTRLPVPQAAHRAGERVPALSSRSTASAAP